MKQDTVYELTIPPPGKRTAIIGRTGSGKTVAALFHLAIQDWDERPWFVFDFKGDEHIAQIPGATEIDVAGDVPSEPGIYILRPFADDQEVENFLMKIWAHENVGVWVDEGYELSKSKGMRRLFTQGRSKRISMVILMQRPVHIDRFVISEADYYQLFELNDDDDYKRVMEFWQKGVDITQELPEFNSWWYDRKAKTVVQLGPMPAPEASIDIIEVRLPEEEKPEKFRFL